MTETVQENPKPRNHRVGITVALLVLVVTGCIVAAVFASKNGRRSERAGIQGPEDDAEFVGDEKDEISGGVEIAVPKPSPSPTRLGAPLVPPVTGDPSPTLLPTSMRPTSSPEPTIGTDGCRTKRIRITHICNVPDLDDSNDDTDMEIKVLINDEIYWPQNTRADCNTGSYRGACEIEDSLLIDQCFPLKNSIEKVFHQRGESDLKLTIYDEDFFFDDEINTYLSNDEWYDPGECGVRELNVPTKRRNLVETTIRLTLTSEETVPTLSPSSSPTIAPTLRPSSGPTEIPTSTPTPGPTSQCGISDTDLTNGLDEMASELENMSSALASINDDVRGGRRLLWGGLIRGVSQFTNAVVKKAGQEGPLSSLADICTLATSSLTFAGLIGGGEEVDERQEELFQQVFERFDAIDDKLDNISTQIDSGFDELEQFILQTISNEILDDLIKGELAQLNDDYLAFINPDHTPSTRRVYEDAFRNSCLNDHSPFTTFRQLYSHACRRCDKLQGQSNQYMLDTFVDQAIQNFDNVEDRIRWFRSSFSTVMIGGMVRSIYLHSVCLYQEDATCQNADPVYRDKLEQMGDALEEVALALSDAEERLKCRRKKVQLTHICDLPDLDIPIIRDDDMDLRFEINGDRYWPMNTGTDCLDGLGSFNNACVIPDSKLMNGKCYSISNSQKKVMDISTTMKVQLIDEDIGFDDTMSWYFSSREWYDDMKCGTTTLEKTHSDGGKLKLKIESEERPEPWKL